MTVEDPRLEKIRALLAKAEATTYPEEAKAFTAKAQELMTKWAIDDAMLRVGKSARDVTEIVSVKIVTGKPPYQGIREQMLSTIARNNDCRVILDGNVWTYRDEQGNRLPKRKRKEAEAYLVGFPQDVEFVQMLLTSCTLQAQTEFLTEDVQRALFEEAPHPGNRIKWRNDFMLGYISAVGRRLWEMRKVTVQEAETATPGVGLVLASKADRVDDKIAQMFGKLSKGSGRNLGGSGGSGWGAGHAAGNRADLGGSKVGQGSRGALGKG